MPYDVLPEFKLKVKKLTEEEAKKVYEESKIYDEEGNVIGNHNYGPNYSGPCYSCYEGHIWSSYYYAKCDNCGKIYD